MNTEYEDRGNSVFEWVYTADSLIESANILKKESYHWSKKLEGFPEFRSYRICDVVTMLYAMAIECLLKTLWLLSGNKLIENGKYSGVNGNKSHLLASLAEQVAETEIVNFDEQEYKFLEELSRNITSGRYPVETNICKQYKDFFVPTKKYEVENNTIVAKNIRGFEDIKKMLEKLYSITGPHVKKEYPDYLGLTKRFS